ncbi:hypothetical protein BDY19DRAFT_928340, partial [Irpex rosettiformis]
VFLLIASFLTVLLSTAHAQESHEINLINRCGSGSPVFNVGGNNMIGSASIAGQVRGGVAWLDNFASGLECENLGVNCGIVNFTLRNDAPNMNEAFFEVSGDHRFSPMSFHFDGACTQGAVCASADHCPDDVPVQCVGANVGISITFC